MAALCHCASGGMGLAMDAGTGLGAWCLRSMVCDFCGALLGVVLFLNALQNACEVRLAVMVNQTEMES